MVRITGSYSESNEDGYTLYTVSGGSDMQIIIEDDDVFENALIDITASGAEVGIYCYSGGTIYSNWVIRNVGVRGQIPANGDYILGPATHGDGLVENCYFGDGCAAYPTSNYGPNGGCAWVPPAHTGHTTFRGVNLQGWVDNGLYLSPPSDVGGHAGRNFTIENCYAKDNTISCYRVGNNDLIRNSFAQASSQNTGTHRGIWAYEGSGPIYVENCNWRDTGGANLGMIIASGTTVHVSDCQYDSYIEQGTFNDQGGNQQTSNVADVVPEGCPTTPLEAATGGSGDYEPAPTYETLPNPGSSLTNAIVFRNESADGSSTEETLEYHHYTDGDVEENTGWENVDNTLGSYEIIEDGNNTHLIGEIPPGEEHRHGFDYESTVGIDDNGIGVTQINDTIINADNFDNPPQPPEDSEPDPEPEPGELSMVVEPHQEITVGQTAVWRVTITNDTNDVEDLDVVLNINE